MILDFTHDYHFENQRVSIRPLIAEDTDSLFQAGSNEAIWTFFDEGGTDYAQFSKYIQDALHWRLKGQQYPFVIIDKKSGQLAGMTRLYAYDKNLKNLKVGHTWLGSAFHKTGVNTASKYELLCFVFDELDLERVGFGVHQQNLPSIAAMKSIGASKEGVLRNFLYSIDGKKRCDLFLYSILKNDWTESIKNQLQLKYTQNL